MAKYTHIYENGIDKTELVFQGETYDYSMLPYKYGLKGDKPCFNIQIGQKHPELQANKKLMELCEEISFDTESDDILKIIKKLDKIEGELK